MSHTRTLARLIVCLALLPASLAPAQQADSPSRESLRSVPRLRRPLSGVEVQAAPQPERTAQRPATRINPTRTNPALSESTQQPAERSTAPRTSATSAPGDIESVLKTLRASGPYDVSSSGRYVVAVDQTGGLMLFDATRVRRLHPLENSRRKYSLVKISPDARWIAAVRASDPDQIDLWRADNGHYLRAIAAEAGAKKSLEFTESGELSVATTTGNGTIYSIPSGVPTGGFQTATGRASVKPPTATFSIKPPTEDATAQAPTSQPPTSESHAKTRRPRTGGSRVGGPSPPAADNPIRETPTAKSAAKAPSAAPAQAAPSVAPRTETEKHLADVLAPEMAPMMASPMQAAAEPSGSGHFAEPAPSAAPMAAAPMAAEPMAAAPSEPAPQAPTSAPAAPQRSFMVRSAPPAASAPTTAAPELSDVAASEPIVAAAPEISPEAYAELSAAEPQAASAAPTTLADLSEEPAAPAPPEEDLTSITVHYATNRQRLTAEDRAFATYFQSFFFTLPAVIGYALILVALIVFPMLGRRVWAAAAVVTGIAILCSMAAFEAYVRSELRDELSGELYGSVPTNLNYGTCKISVPKPENRSPGELNRPLSVWVLEAPENPEKHFTLQQVSEHKDKDEFYESLSTQLAGSADGASLLFIHGYNVSFEDAVFRTAQLAVDLKFPGAPISFSWPSYADPVKYTFDEQNAEVSIPALREFLEDLATRSGAKRIHIVAHSMGNRVLAGALRSMSPEARVKNKAMFREIVLAAPDIDSRVFESQVLPHIQDNTEHCTLYASSRDRALMMSRYFHNYQRLGETQPQLIVANGMDTIDASMVDTSLLGHSYIGDVQSIVSDLHELVVVGKRPTERLWLEAELLGELMYWAIRPETQTASDPKTTR